MTFSHATIAVAGIHCKMDVKYLVGENGVIIIIIIFIYDYCKRKGNAFLIYFDS